MNLMTKIILTTCIICITFVAGYLAGNHATPSSILAAEKTQNRQTAKALSSASTKVISTQRINTDDLQQHSESNPINAVIDSKLNNDSIILDNRDIIALFNDFLTYSTSNSDYQEYGKKIDNIRKVLISSSTELALLLELFEQVPIDSQASYMLISIIMGLPQEVSKPAMQRVMENALLKKDPGNSINFLELVARTGIKSPTITSSLKDIAIFSEKNEETLKALDMLMPYELSNAENQQVRERLKTAIDNSESVDSPYYFSQLLRFSSATQRQQLAIDTFNKTDANNSMQSIIMESIQAGTLDRSSELREALFTIAKQEQNELQHQAIYTLLYRFDLSQDEYEEISRGQDLNIKNSQF